VKFEVGEGYKVGEVGNLRVAARAEATANNLHKIKSKALSFSEAKSDYLKE
jgi:hypothetical protein